VAFGAVAVVAAGLVVPTFGPRCAVTVGFAAVMGVTVMPTTSPMTSSFCFDPIVFRAARVDARFAEAAASASTVSGARVFG
jgi:hypothetical protein